MKIMLDQGAKMPTRAHPYDGGLDLYTTEEVVVPACELRLVYDDYFQRMARNEVSVGSVTIDTGVHVQIPEGCVGLIKSKSGLNVNHGLTADHGVIDAHYTGSIRVKIYNHTRKDYRFNAGDKIAQLVIVPCVLLPMEVVDSFEETDRGDGGFGSTGR